LAGIKPGDFKPGTEITITGRPMRDGRPAAFWVKAVRHVDGKEFVPADEKLAVQKALAGD
jgi:hypothetical protein